MLKVIKKVINILETPVFIILVLIFAIVVSPVLPFKDIPRTYIVVSGSMEPTIKTGSVSLTMPLKPTDAKVGDIVAFTSPSNNKDVILHRIIGIKSQNPLRFETKGDNNNAPDSWDLMDVGILGKQVFSVPYIGNIGAFIKKPLGFGIVIGLPALLFIISQLLNIKKVIAEEVDRKVAQTLKTKEKLKPTNISLKSLIFFIALFSSLVSLSTIQTIKASFSDTVTVSGINISIASGPPDIVLPESYITFPHDDTIDQDKDNGKNEATGQDNEVLKLYNWNGHVTGTASDTGSGIDHVEISIYQRDSNLYWSGTSWVSGSELTRVIADGTTNWEYKFKNPPPTGAYKIVSHAVDKAGNIENSATIEFKNLPTPPMSFDLDINKNTHKIFLNIHNIKTTPLDYEILYQNSVGEQGIAGTISTDKVVDGQVSKEFYLGTCSSGGTCTPDSIAIGSTITVSLGEMTNNYFY